MNTNFRIERKTEVLKRIPFSKATLHRKINDGTFPPSIPLGANSVGFLSHEVDMTILAMATGQDLRETVSDLLVQRQSLLENTFYQSAA
ncbi:transcriptional regulator [Vibrio sp. 10N.286.49.C2]|uniref:Helix-turn-helix transcriptional regulator n=1 Tax=Vibrio chaetopteri TaxID=3016528 RepID=A0AAU8BK54_9VIBR|nr:MULTISPECIES: AlpA family phage regulatory protein [Vibrio]MDR9825856.1 AlpA family phage regulatory protein [Vibrio sp. FNV 38]OCH62662.1 transcriptional regulator [Vibrio splendidus]PMH36286.1 transcriptional regulator [Vibrio sp. 10N.286.49.C2]PMH53402.1 transcriptional regulator [Vibrio sp. 10N.286.49.B1]